MTTPPPDPEPRSPAKLFSAGLRLLDTATGYLEGNGLGGRVTAATELATAAATLAVAHFAAADVAYTFIRERRAEREQIIKHGGEQRPI